jgi:hypothetical protein
MLRDRPGHVFVDLAVRIATLPALPVDDAGSGERQDTSGDPVIVHDLQVSFSAPLRDAPA